MTLSFVTMLTMKMPIADKKITLTIYSFSYKRGLPPDTSGNGGGFVFDCRALPNPFWDERLRYYVGNQLPIEAFFASYSKEVETLLAACETWVRFTCEAYLKDGRTALQVAFGCTGGQHRSVYMAEQFAKKMAHIPHLEIRLEHKAKAFWRCQPAESRGV